MHSLLSAPSRSSRRGAVLIVALLLSAVIAISLGSFLSLSTSSSRLAYRGFYSGAAMNAAETGLEYGMWSVNKQLAGNASAWTGWGGSPHAQRTFDLGTISGGATSQVKVYVNRRDLGGGEPFVVARSIITPPRGAPIEKWIMVTLTKRSRFKAGLIARHTITFKGNNASVDSWDSDPDRNPATAAVAYSAAVRKDNGSVGSVLINNPAVFTNNADVWGTVSTGGVNPTGDVGSNGSILGADSAAKNKSSWIKSTVDPDRVFTDFTADFEPEPTPSGGTTITSVGATLGTAGSTTSFRFSGQIDKSLTIHGHVTLVLTGSGDVIKLTGNDTVALAEGATLKIYTAGNIKLAGKGLLNPNPSPASVFIYGTAADSDNNPATTHQEIDIAGNGDLKAVVFAPNADTTINGNGNVMGSVVSGKITMTGNAAFHYDEALARLDTGEPLGLNEWNEFVSFADREAYRERMSF
jgi:hypothetical protein